MAGAGRKIFPERTTLASADVQNYLMDQTVMRFGAAAARLAAVPAPTEGMHSTLDDADTLYRYDGATWRRVAGYRTVGRFTATVGQNSDSSGLFVFPHGLGAIPASINLTAGIQASTLLQAIAVYKIVNFDATNIVVGMYRTDTSAALSGNPVAFDWGAER